MTSLQRITTEYCQGEDRVRLAGANSQGQTVVLWLTQRLTNRLITHLCRWLEQQSGQSDSTQEAQVVKQPAIGQEVAQSFAQQAAAAALTTEPAVNAAADAPQVLVHSVDVSAHAAGVRLLFKAQSAPHAEPPCVSMNAVALRQWLGIVYAQYRKAEWSTAAWPQWMEEASRPAAPQAQRVLWH